jgi:hypothetical protein
MKTSNAAASSTQTIIDGRFGGPEKLPVVDDAPMAMASGAGGRPIPGLVSSCTRTQA